MKIIKVFKKCKFSFVMCIVTFIIGLFFIELSFRNPLKIRLIISLIGFGPFLSFLILTLLNYYQKNKFGTTPIFLFFCSLGYYLIAIFICAAIETEHPVRDIKDYKKIVSDKRLLNVFPKEVPDDIESPYLSYTPPFLQGGEYLVFYYIDKNFDMTEYDKKYRDKAIWIGHIEEYKDNEGLLTGALMKVPILSKKEGYIIYLVEGDCDNSGYCNHGNYLYVALNEVTREVIFESGIW